MSAAVPWTVVSHAADDSLPATSVPRLMRWLADQPGIDLHTVLWASGHNGKAPYDFGRLADVGSAHERLVARGLRGVGQHRLAGGVAGRAVRGTLRRVPAAGVLYLSSARAGAVLRYLPPGDRTVVTHLHAMDRLADPPLPTDRVAALVEATDVWLVVDEETGAWAAAEWGVDPELLHVVPEPVDPAAYASVDRVASPGHLRLALRGGTWFRRDHAARLVQLLQRRQPALELDLVWADTVTSYHLGPLLHDLRQLDLIDRLELSESIDEVRQRFAEVDVLALTTPDDDAGWVLSEARAAGVPVVCFDTHRSASMVAGDGGTVVPYLEVAEMADAVLDVVAAQRTSVAERLATQQQVLAERGPAAVGARLLAILDSGRSS